MLALYDTIDLGRLPSLQKLTIRYWLANPSDTNRQLVLLCRILRTIYAAASLEELVLHFVIIYSRAPIDPVSGSRSWEVLDSTLADYAPPRLRKVTVQFESIPEQHRREAVEMVSAGLSKLKSNQMLDIQPLCLSSRLMSFSR